MTQTAFGGAEAVALLDHPDLVKVTHPPASRTAEHERALIIEMIERMRAAKPSDDDGFEGPATLILHLVRTGAHTP